MLLVRFQRQRHRHLQLWIINNAWCTKGDKGCWRQLGQALFQPDRKYLPGTVLMRCPGASYDQGGRCTSQTNKKS